MINPATLAKLAPLMRFKDLKVDDITPEVLSEVSSALGLRTDISEGLTGQVVQLLKADNVDGVWDLLGRPETLAKTRELLSPEGENQLTECPFCHEWFVPG